MFHFKSDVREGEGGKQWWMIELLWLMTNEIKLKKDTAEILAFRTEGAEAANEGSGANKPQICALVKRRLAVMQWARR